MPVQISVAATGRVPHFVKGALPLTLTVEPDDTIRDVKKRIQQKIPKYYADRQKLTKKSDRNALSDEATIESLGLGDGAEFEVKDLGPQIGWRLVFLVEYFGPLIIHPLLYNYPNIFYGTDVKHSELQKFVYVFILLHYMKRELETIFVHRFSHGTMPFRNIFKNSTHYWIFGGLFLAYDFYRPAFSQTSKWIAGSVREDQGFLWGCAALFGFFELSNLSVHITMRNLRPAGSTRRAIPYGYGFGLVSVPNYWFEILVWVTITVMTGSYAAIFFTLVSSVQMGAWAVKKHRGYKKEFGKEYPRNRKAMIPFIF